MGTPENLREAFAGESQANRRYLAFAKKADADGFPQVARLFRAVAEAETVHAHGHLRAMNGVGGTVENLNAAIAGEDYESRTMYPAFLKSAEEEGSKAAILYFKYALAVEQVHHRLYAEALAAVKGGKDLPAAPAYICPVCGHTSIGGVPEVCPVCGAKKERYVEIR